MLLLLAIASFFTGMITSKLLYFILQLAVHTVTVLFLVHRLDPVSRQALWEWIDSMFNRSVDPLVDDAWNRATAVIIAHFQNNTLKIN
jgi:predicted PurR-regulated permease PerM